MKALITGVAGFLGARLARRLLEDGWEVQGIDVVPRSGAWRLEGLKVDYIWGACQDTHVLNAPYVVHAAAVADVPFAIHSPAYTIQQNVLGTTALLDAASRQDGFERIVIISSEAVYGLCPRVPIKETEPLNPTNIYGASKAAQEMVAIAYGHSHNLPMTIFRSSTLFGEGSRMDQVISVFLRQALRGEDITIHGEGRQSRDFNYVDNFVDALVAGLTDQRTVGETFNIAFGQELSIAELAKACIGAVGSNSQIRHLAEREWEEGLRLVLDNSKARETFDYAPKIGFQEGLERVATWLSRRNVLPT